MAFGYCFVLKIALTFVEWWM